jgi:hypothetical protein
MSSHRSLCADNLPVDGLIGVAVELRIHVNGVNFMRRSGFSWKPMGFYVTLHIVVLEFFP